MRGVKEALFWAMIAIDVVVVAQQCDDSCTSGKTSRCDEPGCTDCSDCVGSGSPDRHPDDPSPIPLSPPPSPAPPSQSEQEQELEPVPESGQTTVLSQRAGLLVVVGFGAAFTMLTRYVTQLEAEKTGKTEMSSEHFNTGGRDVGIGLTAAVIVSQWTWAATLLQSSNVGWKYGISGPFWYASGATIQVLLFAILAIQVKRRCPVMHTYLEVILLRWGHGPHKVFLCFALVCNCIVSAMLLLGGAATIQQLTGLSTNWSCFLIPIGVLFYTYSGGLKATFFASYIHTCIIFTVLVIFVFTTYSTPAAPEVGSASSMYDSLWKSALMCRSTGGVAYDYPDGLLDNQGVCVPRTDDGLVDMMSTIEAATGSCSFVRCEDEGCASDPTRVLVDQSGHQWEERGCADTEVCVGSFTTMASQGGLAFGIVNIVGNFGTVFIDQAYWQSAVAAQPTATVKGFLVGGLVWFAVPFCMATTFGLAGRALSSSGRVPITFEQADAGLVPAIVITDLLGEGGAFALLTMLFMAVTSTYLSNPFTSTPVQDWQVTVVSTWLGMPPTLFNLSGAFVIKLLCNPRWHPLVVFLATYATGAGAGTGSAEVIAVSSILTYDLFWTYLLPELKEAVHTSSTRWQTAVATAQPQNEMALSQDEIGRLLMELRTTHWLRDGATSTEGLDVVSQGRAAVQSTHKVQAAELYAVLTEQAIGVGLDAPPLYMMQAELQRMGVGAVEAKTAGEVLVRFSRFFTVLFGGFMGFLAVLLERLGLSLGYVYMAMGIMIGSAVVPVSCALLFEKANGTLCTAGAVIGLCLAITTWLYLASTNDLNGEITIASTGGQYPLLFGNIMALCSGGAIAICGSLAVPDETFKWKDLGAIDVIDDVLPPPAAGEDDASLLLESKRAKKQAGLLSAILVFGWPMPMYISGSVMGKTAFSLWIGLACLWAVVAACVITFLAPFEAFQSKGRSQQTLPPVQLQPVELEQSAQNPLSNPTATWQEGRESPLAPDGDATSANIPAAAVDFIRDRRQQQHADSPGLGAFVAEEAEL